MNHFFDIEHAKRYGVVEAVLIANFQFWIPSAQLACTAVNTLVVAAVCDGNTKVVNDPPVAVSEPRAGRLGRGKNW